VARGFLPRGLSSTRPQVCAIRRTVVRHGRVPIKPEQKLKFKPAVGRAAMQREASFAVDLPYLACCRAQVKRVDRGRKRCATRRLWAHWRLHYSDMSACRPTFRLYAENIDTPGRFVDETEEQGAALAQT